MSLGDTIGAGTPASVLRMLEAAARQVPTAQQASHDHDTTAWPSSTCTRPTTSGCAPFDSAVANLGCPRARGATGNVSTEDIVYLLHGLGAETAVDFGALVDGGA